MIKKKNNSGISLIELVVALGLFAVVMLISIGALLAVVDASRKARALESVMDNLSFAIETMSRSIRVGSSYHCGSAGDISSPKDCSVGRFFFAFEPSGGDLSDSSDQVIFRQIGTKIRRSIDGGSTYQDITAPEVSINSLKFYTVGALAGDNRQPRVIITIRGEAGTKAKEITRFEIQTTVSQRAVDD